MAIRQLRQDQDAILRKKCKEVTEIDEKIQMILGVSIMDFTSDLIKG